VNGVSEKKHSEKKEIDSIFQKQPKHKPKAQQDEPKPEKNEPKQSNEPRRPSEPPINPNKAKTEEANGLLEETKIATWPEIGPIMKNIRRQIHHKRKKPSAYDLEYDRGHVKKKKTPWTVQPFLSKANKIFIHYFVPTKTYKSSLHPPSFSTCRFHCLMNRSLSSTPQPCVSVALLSTQRTSASATLSHASS
jgi:hypothetical protein